MVQLIELVLGFAGALLCVITFSVGVVFGLKLGRSTSDKTATAEQISGDVRAKAEQQAKDDREAWDSMMGYSISQAYREAQGNAT